MEIIPVFIKQEAHMLRYYAFRCAYKNGHFDIAKWLISKGVTTDIKL